ncbi:MAG: hypothetical protein GX174_11295 [Lentisphaerae bacterium]|nr:hypothetical protein [Lentisphaerota bacterium]
MTPARAGFSLIEALLACALLAMVLVPVLVTFRTHLGAVDRMSARLRLEHTCRARLDASEARVRAGITDPLPSGRQPGGLVLREIPPAAEPCGAGHFWHLAIEATDPGTELTTAGERFLILMPQEAPEGEAP